MLDPITELLFLNYHIGPRGVGMETNKVSTMSEWPEPNTVKQLQRFLGFTNFYQRFIRGYSSVAALLTDLFKGKPKHITLTPES